MYISLYSRQEIKKTKSNILYFGLFFLVGGGYALVREVFVNDAIRVNWLLASAALLFSGIIWVLVGSNKIHLNDAYFSIKPDKIDYRLAIFAKSRVIFWKDIKEIDISKHRITLHLNDIKKSISINLGNIQQPEVANHVSRSLHLAAYEKGIMVNGVHVRWAEPTVQI